MHDRERQETSPVVFRVPQPMLHEIDRRAREARRSRSDWLRLLIEDALGLSPSPASP